MLKFNPLLLTFLFFFHAALGSITGDDNEFTIVEEGSKKGLFDTNGKVIIPVIYDDLGWSQGLPTVFHKVLGYREADSWGLIHVKNHKITTPLFNSLQPFYDKLIIASKKDNHKHRSLFGLINTKGEQELEFRYHSLEKHNEQLIASVLEKNFPLYGVINAKGEALLGFKYNHIFPLSDKTYAVYNHTNQVGLFDVEGNFLTEFLYDSIAPFQHHLAVVYQNGRQGVIREDGIVVVPVKYNRVKINGAHQVSVLPFGKWHVFSAENKHVREYTYESIKPAGVNLYQVKIGDLKTFIDTKGNTILPEQWHVTSLVQRFAIVAHKGKYGVLSNSADTNQIILQPEYDSLVIDESHILACKKINTGEGAWTLHDSTGQLLTNYVYQDAKKSSEGFFPVKRKNYWGYVNLKGEEAIACQFMMAEPFKQSRAKVDFIEGQGIINTSGNWVVKPFKHNGATLHLDRIHDDLYIFSTQPYQYQPAKYGLVDSEGREIYVSSDQLIDNGSSVWERNVQGKYGLISYQGQRLLETKYDTISALQENVAYIFAKEGKSGILSSEGKMLVNLDNNFQELHPISEKFFGVKIDNKFGFVDTLGRLRIANRYDSITHYQSGMAAISLLGRWGYISKSEKLVVQPQFDRAYPFSGGLAVVKKDGKLGMVNKKGETVVPIEYDRITPGKENRFLVTRENNGHQQVGLVSRTGRSLIYPKYDSLLDLENGYVVISRGDKFGLLTMEGRSTIPLIYDDIIYDAYNDIYLALETKGWQSIDLPAVQSK